MQSNPDIITLPGLTSVAATMEKIEQSLTSHGVFIYAIIDQEAEAKKVNLKLNPLRLLIFGNPKGGIPIMNANPLAGLDLPLKVLVWQDDQKKVWVSYNSFSYLQKRFDLPETLITNITGVEKIIQGILKQ